MKFLIKLLTLARNVSIKIFNSAIGSLERNDNVVQLHRWNVTTPAEATSFLKDRVKFIIGADNTHQALIVAQNQAEAENFARGLLPNPSMIATIESVNEVLQHHPKVSCIVSLEFHEKTNFLIAKQLLSNPSTINIPFEYIGNAFFDYEHWKKYDRYQSTHFISPLLHYNFDVMKLHEESLLKFDLKCDVRDYMDIAQSMMHIARGKVPGDIAEFGSFKGHSGYLITQLSKSLDLQKKIYLFDMFENFPEESIGIDAFWSKTHIVDFNDVKSKFREFPNVQLVKGDFTTTLKKQQISSLSLVHVDCDSFRATQYVMEQLFDGVLSRGGLMLFEDYGHPGLLGSRVAIDEFFEKRSDVFLLFSQASGYLIAYKH